MGAQPVAALWLAAALVPMVASQLLRLQQVHPAAWLFWDYAGRIGALAVLLAIPAARAIAFRHQALRPARWDAGLRFVIGLVLAHFLLGNLIARLVDAAIPGTALGTYPVVAGWLHALDLTAGIALVAYHEEVVFRRLAREALQPWIGDGTAMIVATASLFGAYHWWSGAGNICMAFLVGVLLMLAYRHLAALWPLVVAHYLVDLGVFL
jgi:hypothetical protein